MAKRGRRDDDGEDARQATRSFPSPRPPSDNNPSTRRISSATKTASRLVATENVVVQHYRDKIAALDRERADQLDAFFAIENLSQEDIRGNVRNIELYLSRRAALQAKLKLNRSNISESKASSSTSTAPAPDPGVEPPVVAPPVVAPPITAPPGESFSSTATETATKTAPSPSSSAPPSNSADTSGNDREAATFDKVKVQIVTTTKEEDGKMVTKASAINDAAFPVKLLETTNKSDEKSYRLVAHDQDTGQVRINLVVATGVKYTASCKDKNGVVHVKGQNYTKSSYKKGEVVPSGLYRFKLRKDEAVRFAKVLREL